MRLQNRDLVIRAVLSILPTHLQPYVVTTVRGLSPQEQRRLIEAVHLPSAQVDVGDLSTQIRILTARDQDGRYVLALPKSLGGKLHEVRHIRNDAVHGRPFDADATLAALVAVNEVLRRIGKREAMAEVRELIAAIDEGAGADGVSGLSGADNTSGVAAREGAEEAEGATGAAGPEPAAGPGGAGRPAGTVITVRAHSVPVLSYAHAVAALEPRVELHLTRHDLTDDQPAADGRAPQGPLGASVSIIEEGEGNEIAGPTALDWELDWQWEDSLEEYAASALLPLHRERLLQITQPAPSHIRVEVRLPDGTTQVRTLPGPTILPARQWQMAGQESEGSWAALSLATFVQPDQPALAALVAGARARLAAAGAPEDGDALVSAVCAALRARGLRIEPPRSPWAAAPHPIRSAEALLDTRQGTTLDLAILLAGLLERLGVPVCLLAMPDSVLVGYWRGQEEPAALGEASQVVGLAERDLLGVVDPALLAHSSTPALHLLPEAARLQATAALAEVAPAQWLDQTRSQGAVPQAHLERDEDGVIQECAPQALAEPQDPQPQDRADRTAHRPQQEGVGSPDDSGQGDGQDAEQGPAEEPPARVREWKQRLLDLTAHNPLIDRSRQQAIPLRLPAALISDLERIVRAKDLVVLRPASAEGAEQHQHGEDEQDAPAEQQPVARLLTQERVVEVELGAKDYGSRMRTLATKARTIVEDTGANNLYLAFGTMEWQAAGRRARSPLVLIPVTLHPSGDHYGLILDEAGESTPNYSFLARFAADTGIDLSDLVEQLRPERDEDFLTTLEAIRHRLARAGRPEEVHPTVHLGLFQFSTYRMWRDLEDSWRPIADNPLVRYLIETPDPAQQPFTDPAAGEEPGGPGGSGEAGGPVEIDEVVENLPLIADATQARVVADAVAGRSLVVEGPPGTGKSQTVANLIFRALAAGRTVMFVAEKRTALDVVARRLRTEAGIGDLILNLHDNGMKSGQVRQSLRNALELRAENIDLGDLEERRRTVRELRARLEDYRRRLHEPDEQGSSRYEDYEGLVAAAQEEPAAATPPEQGEQAPARHLGGGQAFDAAAHNQLVEDYRSAVARLRELLPAELLCSVLGHRDRVLTRDTERTLALHREISRRKGSMTIREMLEAYADLITAITPCILVSPDSVARFFPAGRRYVDIVVFDEASQIPVPNAVGAIGRGGSVVIAGDPKQMPPTSIATSLGVQGMGHDDLGGVLAQEEDSILTQCLSAQMRHYRLPWHYRSRVESLITFSNEHYYDGALRSFPSPLAMTAGPDDAPGGHGITLRRVQGQYFRPADLRGRGKARPRTNPYEAQQVVAEVMRHFEASPERTPSLGVITFNDKQRDLIEELLRQAGSARVLAALEEEDGLFVKNLENVQGEERDTILFSVTFSAGSQGSLPLNFGPLSREGGQRRLNVAITRARRQILVFCSFDPEQLHAERTSHQGVKDLRAYLERARDAGAPPALTTAGAPDWYRHAMAEELRTAGLAVSEGVGQSSFTIDLVLARPDRPAEPAVAVVLDGREWNRRESAADRDLMPVDVLRTMGWPRVERVWAPEWAADKEAVITRLVRACGLSRQDAQAAPEGGEDGVPAGAEQPATPAPADDSAGGPRGGGVSGGARAVVVPEYRSWVPEQSYPQSVLDQAEQDAASRREVQRVARRICEVEAPLSRHRLVVKVCRAFGLSRTTASRQESVRRILGEAFAYIDDYDFVWVRMDQVHTAPPYRRRALDHLEGAIEEVHPRELAGAISAVRSSSSAWTSREDLFLQVLKRLSAKRRRLTPRAWTALTEALVLVEQDAPEEG